MRQRSLLPHIALSSLLAACGGGPTTERVPAAPTNVLATPGTEYTATASTDASGELGVAQNPSVTGHGDETVSLAWDAPAGAESYAATIYDAPLRVGANAFGSAITTDTALTVVGLALPVGEYYATVFAFPIDRTVARPLKPAEFDVSAVVTGTFGVGAAGCVDPDPISDPNLAAAIHDDLGLSALPSCADLLDLAYSTLVSSPRDAFATRGDWSVIRLAPTPTYSMAPSAWGLTPAASPSHPRTPAPPAAAAPRRPARAGARARSPARARG